MTTTATTCATCHRPMWWHSFPKDACPPKDFTVSAPLEKIVWREAGVANKATPTLTYGFGRADANNQGGEDHADTI